MIGLAIAVLGLVFFGSVVGLAVVVAVALVVSFLLWVRDLVGAALSAVLWWALTSTRG